MDRVKKITYQQLVDFVNQQKPDREIDSLCCSGKGIGCLLTQYCRKTFKNKITDVGYFSCLMHKGDVLYTILCDESCATLLKKALEKRFVNYSQLQKFVKENEKPKKYYKLLSQHMTSYNYTKWKIGVPVSVTKKGNEMCTDQVLHCYNHPLLAVLLNPVHAKVENARLFEIEIDSVVNNDALKFASKSQTLVKEISLPKISSEQKIEFAIRVAKLVCKNKDWNLWADSYLNNKDDRESLSKRADYFTSAYYTGAIACARYASRAAYLNYFGIGSVWYVIKNLDNSVASCVTSANDDYGDEHNYDYRDEFNQKIIDIIEEIVKVKQ